MSPPFIVAPRTNIVDETPPSTRKFKIRNLEFFTFRKLKSATKSKQNRLTKRNRSKSTENRSKRVVNEAPPSSGIIKKMYLKMFTYAELKSATRNFRPDTVLGEGGFGRVFKGWVDETYSPSKVGVGMAVAVKKSNPESAQGIKEWQTEVEFLGNLSHPNIIKLVGYCSKEDKECLLVYEYMPKGSLENHIFRKSAEPLPWSIRIKIVIGAARGLAFLHSLEKPVIYRDFKTSNILLDGDYNAKLSDFGLAKYAPSKGDAQIKGTLGPTNSDMQVTTQTSSPSSNTKVTTQIRGTLSSANTDTHLTVQICWSNCETHVTTQIRSMLGSTNNDLHVTTQTRGMSNLANGDRHVTTHIITCPANSDTHVTTQIRGALHQAGSNWHVTTRVIGTYGYADPEYVATGHLYVKSDVYGFGVVLLEMLTGLVALDTTNRPTGEHNLVDWAKPSLFEKKRLKKIMDPQLKDEYPLKAASQAAQLVLKCLESNPKNRPSMAEVLENLEQIHAIKVKTKAPKASPMPRTSIV